MVVPNGHDEYHRNQECFVELVEAANLGKAVTVAEGLECGSAEFGRKGHVGGCRDSVELRPGDIDLLAILDYILDDLVGLELGDDTEECVRDWKKMRRARDANLRELLAGVDGLSFAIKVLVTHSVGIVITTVGVTLAGEVVVGVGTATGGVLADVIGVGRAWVRGEGKSMRVGFPFHRVSLLSYSSPDLGPNAELRCAPDIDLGAAGTIRTDAGVGVIGGGFPPLDIGLQLVSP